MHIELCMVVNREQVVKYNMLCAVAIFFEILNFLNRLGSAVKPGKEEGHSPNYLGAKIIF